MKINFHKIRYKLILMFLILIIILISAVVIITYNNSVSIIRDQSIELNNKLLDMGTSTLKSSIEQTDKIFQSLYTNNNFKQYLRDRAAQPQINTARAYEDIKSILLSLLSSRKDLFSIIYIDKSGYLIYTTQYEAGSITNINNFALPDEYRDILNNVQQWKEGRIIVPTYKHIPLKYNPSGENQYVYSIARKIINIENKYEYVGIMFININLSTLQLLSKDIVPYQSAFTYVVSNDGTIVYDSLGRKTGSKLEEDIFATFNKPYGNETISINGELNIAVYSTEETTGWKIINFIPQHLYTANVVKVTNIVIIVGIIVIIFAVIAITFSSKIITDPIEKLSRLMDEIELESMNIRATEKGKDEITTLSKNFNRLLNKLQNAIRSEYEMGISQKDAEMKALQAQINPHFLYNVLQSMSSIALINGIEEINIMAKSLGKMLRYSIKTEKNVVSVDDECKHVENYLAIQKIRYGERLEYHLNIPRYVRDKEILKLTLQPIVENSIVHGFEKCDGRGIIYITGELDGGDILFDISDNGKGMTPDELDRLRQELDEAQSGFFTESSPNIGIKNVLTRLKIRYDSAASILIESEQGIGTSIKIRIPAHEHKEGEQLG